MASSRRTAGWIFWVVVGGILLALPVGYWVWLHEPPPPVPAALVAPPVEEAPAAPVELALGTIAGDVKIRRANGEWRAATEGEALKSADSVRTGDGAHAVLVGGKAYEVKLEPGTEVSVEEITASISRLQLGGGMASARVAGEAKHTFEIRAAGSDASARTTAGAFAISNNAEGTVAVGTREGEVEFFGSGRVVIVRAGQQSIIRPGEGPSEPTEIPKSLLLKVSWPADRVISRRTVVLTGQSEPGSLVEIDGKMTRVANDGSFSQRLTLKEGRNPLKVHARGVGGTQVDEQRTVGVDTRGPASRIDADLWGTQK